MASRGAGVQSIERAFVVLRAVATGPAGVTDLARRVELPTSTVARLLGTLEALGAVTRTGDGVTYRIGATVAALAAAADGSPGVVAAARLHLEELVERTGETAGVSVADGDEVLYLEHVDAITHVQVRDWSGMRLPLHVVSSGLVLLAHRPPAEIDAYLAGPLKAFTDRTVVDPDLVRRRLADIRRDGFVWTVEEYHEGLTSVAAPVLASSGEAVAAVHCHGPSFRFPASGTEATIGGIVRAAASRLAVSVPAAPG